MSNNPFESYGVPDIQDNVQGLVDQAVVLNTALVPKLPEINVCDGMIPILDEIYCDSGSTQTFTPGSTITFNFGNAKGKLVDWTQSKLCYDVEISVENTCLKPSGDKFQQCTTGMENVHVGLRHGAQVFEQVTLGGAGRPITFNDWEMIALANHLTKICETNKKTRIGECCTYDFAGCAVPVSDWSEPTAKITTVKRSYTIPVSIPATCILPMFQGVDNYLMQATSGNELRLTVTTKNGVLTFMAPEPVDSTTGWKFDTQKGVADVLTTTGKKTTNYQFYNRFRPDVVKFDGLGTEPNKYVSSEDTVSHRMTATLVKLSNVKFNLISTQHPDDTLINMLTRIAMTRGLFYPFQMCVVTPFNITIPKGNCQHHVLIPMVSGYRNVDTIFAWITYPGKYSQLKKLPCRNVYTSLNGQYKTPVHGYKDDVRSLMNETSTQFQRAFGTINSTILAPLRELTEAYQPSAWVANRKYHSDFWDPDKQEFKSEEKKQEYRENAVELEYLISDSFILNSTVWELEKSSWMNGPDLSNHSNKYQLVFETYDVSEKLTANYTLWIVQRFDAYTHIYDGYINVLTSKGEVAYALQCAANGQALTA